jgi:hypothetical protein
MYSPYLLLRIIGAPRPAALPPAISVPGVTTHDASVASGALSKTIAASRHRPMVAARLAGEFIAGRLHDTSGDAQYRGVHQAIGCFAPRRRNQIAERLPRDAHFFGGLLLIQALQVRQPQRFQFIQGEQNFPQVMPRYPGRLE